MYDAIQQRIGDYDKEIVRKLATMQREDLGDQPPPAVKNPQKAKAIKKRSRSVFSTAMAQR